MGAGLHELVIQGNSIALNDALENNKENIEAKDCYGKTPLMLACELGKDDCVKTLLSHGAYVHAKNILDGNRTPMGYAVMGKHWHVHIMDMLQNNILGLDNSPKVFAPGYQNENTLTNGSQKNISADTKSRTVVRVYS